MFVHFEKKTKQIQNWNLLDIHDYNKDFRISAAILDSIGYALKQEKIKRCPQNKI